MNSTKYSSMRNHQRQLQVIEVIPNKLFWSCSLIQQKKDDSTHIFSTDLDYVYTPFFKDFGPLNLGLIHRYIQTIDKMLNEEKLKGYKIYHSTSNDISKKTSSALLMGCYMVLKLGFSPENTWDMFQIAGQFRPYRDPANNVCYEQRLIDCWKGLLKANQMGWYQPDNFDSRYYKCHSKPENGNFNIIVPNKFVAFNGPYFARVDLRGYRRNIVEDYYEPFKNLGVTTVVRLNTKDYDEKKFISKGFRHLDYYFPDGSAPRKDLIQKFLNQIEGIDGSIAVHCHAGLGRTATMIGAYVIKHYKFTASEFIAWVRICRPGSVHGPQQLLLQEIELDLLNEQSLSGGNNYQAAVPKNIYTKRNQNQGRSNTLKPISQGQNGNNLQKSTPQLFYQRNQGLQIEIQSNRNSIETTNQQQNKQIISKTPQVTNKSYQINNNQENSNKFDYLSENSNSNNNNAPKLMQKSLTNLSNIFNRTSLHYPLQSSNNQQIVLPSLKNDYIKSNYLSANRNNNVILDNNKKKKNIIFKKGNMAVTQYKENNFLDNEQNIPNKKQLAPIIHA